MRYLRLEKDLYGIDSLVTIFRDDAKTLIGSVVDFDQGAEGAVNMTGRSASAYFQGETDNVIKPVTFTGTQGEFSVSLSTSDTPKLDLNDDGVSFYLVTDQNETIETRDTPLAVKDRGFQSN